MKYRTFDDMTRVADRVTLGAAKLSRRERLERWAELLMQHPERRLKPLYRLEFMPLADRLPMRDDDTPLAVAYADPLLREQGLTGDRVADAMQFFELSSRDIHLLVCDCQYMGTMTASLVAGQIRAIARRITFRELYGRIAGFFVPARA